MTSTKMNSTENDSPLSDIRIGEITHHWASSQNLKSFYSKATESTNTQAKNEAFSEVSLNEQLTLYVTDLQTAGRGRGKNTWSQAPRGSQLLSTWSFMIDQSPLPTFAPQVGLAIYRAALATWPFLKWNLKAPNDLYIEQKKIAGLLIETVSQGEDIRLLIGLGFNVIAAPAEVAIATNLVKELGPHSPLLAEDWIAFLERLLFEFSNALQFLAEPLNSTTTHSLLHALNQHPLLTEKYLDLDSQGNLKTESKNIRWSDL